MLSRRRGLADHSLCMTNKPCTHMLAATAHTIISSWKLYKYLCSIYPGTQRHGRDTVKRRVVILVAADTGDTSHWWHATA